MGATLSLSAEEVDEVEEEDEEEEDVVSTLSFELVFVYTSLRLLAVEVEALLLPLGSTITEDEDVDFSLCCGQAVAVAEASEEPKLSLAVDLLSRLFVYLRLLVGVVDKSLYVHCKKRINQYIRESIWKQLTPPAYLAI